MTPRVTYGLAGCKALVTGAASGIGLATARKLAGAGAKVAVNYLPGDTRGEDAVATLRAEGADVVAAPGQVGVPQDTERMVEKAIADLGGLDLLVNNAGTPGVKAAVPIERLDLVSDELWEAVLSTNLLGVFRCTKAAADALRASGGSVVNTASVVALGGSTGSSMAYAASKAGVVNLTRSLARSLAPQVRVNAIAPGAVDSTWLEWTPQQRREQIERSRLKRIGSPSEYADAILFLAFGTGLVTGQTLLVDAGMTL